MNGGDIETKSEIRARIHELEHVRDSLGLISMAQVDIIDKRLQELHRELGNAEEDVSAAIVRSHKAICEVKQMDEKDAYGNDPAIYYTLGVCGEAGEMANAIVKSLRNGNNRAKILEAVKSELPDVIIYSYVLAYVLGINLSGLVNEKVGIVIKRAYDGYYGGVMPVKIDVNGQIHEVPCGDISYEDVVVLAYPGTKLQALSMTFRKGINGQSGILTHGQKVKVIAGMSFHVIDTSNA